MVCTVKFLIFTDFGKFLRNQIPRNQEKAHQSIFHIMKRGKIQAFKNYHCQNNSTIKLRDIIMYIILNLPGLEELKIWVHIFLCMPMQVCVHLVLIANFVHMNYLCVHTCTQIVYATMYVIMYFTQIFSQCCIILCYTTLKYVILVGIINNENLSQFSSLTTGKVS